MYRVLMSKRVYYDTKDYYVLPEKFHLDHEYCMYLHDQLVKIIVEGDHKGFFAQTIKIKEKMPKGKGEEILNWMRENGFKEEAESFMVKNIFAATLSDALQFIITALKCSDKGKLSVTYANLRKPLKDNLFILELLNVDKADFFKRFKNPSDLLDIGRFSEQDKKDIINKNSQKIRFHANYNAIIYGARYSKSSNGLEPLFQRANHIVTSSPHYKTENENLNFVFSNEKSLDSQWNKLYKILPFLLRYFVDTAYHILNENITDELKDELSLIDILYYRRHYPEFVKNMPFNIICQKCGKSQEATKELLDLCDKNRNYVCSCGESESITSVELTKP